jgi:hypothetical protein
MKCLVCKSRNTKRVYIVDVVVDVEMFYHCGDCNSVLREEWKRGYFDNVFGNKFFNKVKKRKEVIYNSKKSQ